MTAAGLERRLDAVSEGLSGRERAVLYLRTWASGEASEAELAQLRPRVPDAEFDGVVQAVQQVNNSIYQNSALWLEWVVLTTEDVAWLQSLIGYQARLEALERALRECGVDVVAPGQARRRGRRERLALAPLPPPNLGFRRDLPILCGVLSHDEPEVPKDWKEAVEALKDEARDAVSVRWRELAGAEIALLEVGEALGEYIVHAEVRAPLDALRERLLVLHAELVPIVGPFVLPEPDEEELTAVRECVDWKALTGRAGRCGPGYLATGSGMTWTTSRRRQQPS